MYFGLHAGAYFGGYLGSVSDTSGVTVPDVVGLTTPNALAQLTAYGLDLSITRVYNPSVAYGVAISQIPAAGSFVPEGTIVSVTFSLGPQPVYTLGYWAAKRQRSENTV